MTREHHLIEHDNTRRRWLITEFVTCTADRHDTLNAAKNHGCQCPEATTIRNRYEKARRVGVVKRERDATGTTRRLQALAADGWPAPLLAERLNLNPVTISNLRRAFHTNVFGATAEAVAALYDELAPTIGPSDRTRAHATRQGWHPREAWDGLDIDDPNILPACLPCQPFDDLDVVAVERAMRGEPVEISRDERLEALRRLLAAGVNKTEIARRLHLSGQTVNALLAKVAA